MKGPQKLVMYQVCAAQKCRIKFINCLTTCKLKKLIQYFHSAKVTRTML